MFFPLLSVLLACGVVSDETPATPPSGRTLLLGAYAAARDAYGVGLVPAFIASWKARTGETITVSESYQASGAQARAVKEGLEADVVALSLELDVRTLVEAGLVKDDWNAGPTQGMASHSIVVIAVRPGNPKGIRGWEDLKRPDVEVLTPNVRTSGGAMWNVLGLWGGARRAGHDGLDLLTGVLKRVRVMDKSGRDSIVTFENGVGDAAITYEHEIITAQQQGRQMDAVIPPSTLRIDNPIAIVDTYASQHGNLDLAVAFVDFVRSEEGQRTLVEYGLRSFNPAWNPPNQAQPADLFTITDLGGWSRVKKEVFDTGAVYDQALQAAQLQPL
jgi:sulfate/thiosulfate-binding protein